MWDDFLYRLAGALSGGVFGAIFGALAAVVGLAIARLFVKTKPQSWQVGTVSVGIALGTVLAKTSEIGVQLTGDAVRGVIHQKYVLPVVDKIVVRRALLKPSEISDFYGDLERVEPVLFDDIVDTVAKGARQDATELDLINAIRAQLIQKFSAPRFGYMADDDIIEMGLLMVAIQTELAKKVPKLALKC